MYQNWVETTAIGTPAREDIWAVDYAAHPLLDPDFHRNGGRLIQLMRQNFHRIVRDDDAYREELGRFFLPGRGGDGELPSLERLTARAAEYLDEADVYLASTINLLPAECRPSVLLLPVVTDCSDVRDLMGISIHSKQRRVRYEARRKLYLAQMLLQIDQSRSVQDGPAHLTRFEGVLDEGLFAHTRQIHDLRIGYRREADSDRMEYTSRPAEGDMVWDFKSTFVEKLHAGRKVGVDILYHNCRFKRSVAPIGFEIVDGAHRVTERVRWGDMRQASSGSILSKMIRNGINNPDLIGDIIGAMFIVNDNEALTDLLVLIDGCLGTPFGWRNVTDTLAEKPGGRALNAYSSKSFKVFKGDLDVLFDDPGRPAPYRFPVEVQIFTLESYLRTVCGSHEASHLALKLRQFLYGLVPKIFPARIYGKDWLRLDQPPRDAGRGRA